MSRRIRLRVAYDGTAYHGWQLQQNGNSIEAELISAIERILGERVEVIGASRTDAGVHSYGNVAVFDTASRIPAEKIRYALNTALPGDIRVLCSDEVPGDWHPRHVECRKTYEYRILQAPIPLPDLCRFAHYTYHALDTEAMAAAGKLLCGEHDYATFCAAGSQAKSTVRTVYDIDLERRALSPELFSLTPIPPSAGATPGNAPQPSASPVPQRPPLEPALITIRVTGNGFLYNMVRILAGTLTDVGMGRKTPEQMPGILASGDRRQAGPTLPPEGLFLMGYEYL
ncbi:MAG: tRNA pseudouridine(38-40) synthase TruA [Lachnospiraceae bacterium]|nr:tRNA pseudouridine(38-40) synthase TruA [Lachnospiraceae bacterium]